MRYVLCALIFVPAMSIAANMLDMDNCKKYELLNQPYVLLYAEPKKNEQIKEFHDKTIRELKSRHDDAWKEWEIRGKLTERYYVLCKGDFDARSIIYSTIECDGSDDLPLQNLSCRYDYGDEWYSKCTVKDRPDADIRLYWPYLRKSSEVTNSKVFEAYKRDLQVFNAKCHDEQYGRGR